MRLRYPIVCACDLVEIAAERDRIRKTFQEAEEQKTTAENRARQEFERGEVKESTQLFQPLDRYSAHYKFMFVDAEWHPLKTVVTFNAKIPVKDGVDVGAFGKIVQNHARNTVTYGGGLSGTVSGQVGKLGGSGTLTVQGAVTVDGAGNVGQTDLSGSLTGSASAGSYEATGTLEASTSRGCKVSAEVTRLTADTLKPPNAPEAWSEYMDTIGLFKPEKPRKVLWSGEYQPRP